MQKVFITSRLEDGAIIVRSHIVVPDGFDPDRSGHRVTNGVLLYELGDVIPGAQILAGMTGFVRKNFFFIDSFPQISYISKEPSPVIIEVDTTTACKDQQAAGKGKSRGLKPCWGVWGYRPDTNCTPFLVRQALGLPKEKVRRMVEKGC